MLGPEDYQALPEEYRLSRWMEEPAQRKEREETREWVFRKMEGASDREKEAEAFWAVSSLREYQMAEAPDWVLDEASLVDRQERNGLIGPKEAKKKLLQIEKRKASQEEPPDWALKETAWIMQLARHGTITWEEADERLLGIWGSRKGRPAQSKAGR